MCQNPLLCILSLYLFSPLLSLTFSFSPSLPSLSLLCLFLPSLFLPSSFFSYLFFFTFLSQPSDWYSVTLADLKEIGASSIISKIKLAETLQEKYPDFKWEKVYLLKGKGGPQRRLEHEIAELFPVRLLSFIPSLSFFSSFFVT